MSILKRCQKKQYVSICMHVKNKYFIHKKLCGVSRNCNMHIFSYWIRVWHKTKVVSFVPALFL